MAWIESHQELRNHPKTIRLCEVLNISRVQAVGHLHFLWWWCVDYALRGDLRRFAHAQIAQAADWPGEPADFVDALVKVSFLDVVDNHLEVHDWQVFCGALVERRLKRRAQNGPLPYQPDQPNPTNPTNQPADAQPDNGFLEFWAAYPNKVDKKRATKCWTRLAPKPELQAVIMAALHKQKMSHGWTKERGRFIPHPTTWLNGARWEDQSEQQGPNGVGVVGVGEKEKPDSKFAGVVKTTTI